MELSENKMKEFIRRLLQSRMRILCNNGFYGLLLMHIIFSLDENCETAATDGLRIYFGPGFLDEISDPELDFVLMHEILHIVLEHTSRQGERDHELFNVAADIVVNSTILQSLGGDEEKISVLGDVSMHLTPDGEEGCNYTVEQVYQMLEKPGVSKRGKAGKNTQGRYSSGGNTRRRKAQGKITVSGSGKKPGAGGIPSDGFFWDDHSKWKETAGDKILKDTWMKRLEDACMTMEIRDPGNERGMLPLFASRLLKELREPQIDWRKILNEFVQEEVMDYSFYPPDRRFDGGDFFLPDFNEKEDKLEDILFMIDTSGSISDDMIVASYSEIKGAIDQFDGKLTGWLGFFDAAVAEPRPFGEEDDITSIRPMGGGGTDFCAIFRYVQKHMQDKLPASIIIMTDGYAPFPREEAAMGIPVLWLLNNEKVNPPWGRVARINVLSG